MEIPTHIDRFRILSVVGAGAIGTVYKAVHEGLDRTVAIKVLNRNVMDTDRSVARFDQEAKAISKLDHHENLVNIHDYGLSDDGVPYLVMDYIEGVNLHDQIRETGCLNEQQAITIFIGVSKGLTHAHSKGIIHRDLKPSNIIIAKDDTGTDIPKIVDFGIAKRQSVDQSLTQTGEIFGTPYYMSPEQCLGEVVEGYSDIYSLGCVMYEALGGSPPFVGNSTYQTIFHHVNTDPISLRKSNAELSPAIDDIVLRCLEKKAENRFTADELLDNLKRIQAGARYLPMTRWRSFKKCHLRAISMGVLLPLACIACGFPILSFLGTILHIMFLDLLLSVRTFTNTVGLSHHISLLVAIAVVAVLGSQYALLMWLPKLANKIPILKPLGEATAGWRRYLSEIFRNFGHMKLIPQPPSDDGKRTGHR